MFYVSMCDPQGHQLILALLVKGTFQSKVKSQEKLHEMRYKCSVEIFTFTIRQVTSFIDLKLVLSINRLLLQPEIAVTPYK